MSKVIWVLMLSLVCSMSYADSDQDSILPSKPLVSYASQEAGDTDHEEEVDDKIKAAAYVVTERYGISLLVAYEISKYAHILSSKYSGFPRARDIIAIAWIESSMNPKARTKWAEGLMGVNYKAHELDDPKKKRFNIKANMEHGVEILRGYYEDLKSRDLALMAYNYGVTSVKRGRRNYTYVHKYKRELKNLGEIK